MTAWSEPAAGPGAGQFRAYPGWTSFADFQVASPPASGASALASGATDNPITTRTVLGSGPADPDAAGAYPVQLRLAGGPSVDVDSVESHGANADAARLDAVRIGPAGLAPATFAPPPSGPADSSPIDLEPAQPEADAVSDTPPGVAAPPRGAHRHRKGSAPPERSSPPRPRRRPRARALVLLAAGAVVLLIVGVTALVGVGKSVRSTPDQGAQPTQGVAAPVPQRIPAPSPATTPAPAAPSPNRAPQAPRGPASAQAKPARPVKPPLAAGPEKLLHIWLTGYSFQDNTPEGSSTVSHPVLHKVAGGSGTYQDPITVAVPGQGHGIWTAGSRFYLPTVQRYVIVEDTGASQPPSGQDGHLDMWVDGEGGSKSASDSCMDKITGTGIPAIYDPAPGEPVMSGPITSNGSCHIPASAS